MNKITEWLAKPSTIVLFLCFCGGWLFFFSIESLTTVLSVIAITMSQLILAAGECDTKAIQKKLDELIHATDKADDAVAGIELKEKSK